MASLNMQLWRPDRTFCVLSLSDRALEQSLNPMWQWCKLTAVTYTSLVYKKVRYWALHRMAENREVCEVNFLVAHPGSACLPLRCSGLKKVIKLHASATRHTYRQAHIQTHTKQIETDRQKSHQAAQHHGQAHTVKHTQAVNWVSQYCKEKIACFCGWDLSRAARFRAADTKKDAKKELSASAVGTFHCL